MEIAPFTDLITPDVRISLLGTPRIEWAGQSFVIPRRQTRALLFYLATRLQSTSRDRLHLLLWPDWPESLARRHLTRLLSHLRRALPAPEILIATEEEIRLDPHRVWSDTANFECLYATRHPFRRIKALRQAASLYRGPFLDGFSLPNSEMGAIGQPDAGVMSGGGYTLAGGLWGSSISGLYRVYLPLVMRN